MGRKRLRDERWWDGSHLRRGARGDRRRGSHREWSGTAAGREEAEVADLDEADGENVEEEAADEFVRRQADRAPVLGGEAHARLVGGEQAVVRWFESPTRWV